MKLKKSPETAAKRRALAKRERIKKKKPNFRQQESWRYKRLKEKWRSPRGIDSKMRKKVKGWPKSIAIGYRGPKEARGLHPSGYEEVLIRTLDELGEVDPKTQAIRIAHIVGAKKRVEISARARERGIYILNPKEEKEELEEEKVEEEAEKSEQGERSEKS